MGASLFNAIVSYESFFFIIRNKYKKGNYENSNVWLRRFFRNTDRHSLLETFCNITIFICEYEYYLLVDDERAYKLLEMRDSIEIIANKSSVGVKEICTLLLQKTAFILRRVRIEPLRYITSNLKEETIYPDKLDVGDYSLFEKICEQCSDPDSGSKDDKIAPFVFKMRDYRTSLKMRWILSQWTMLLQILKEHTVHIRVILSNKRVRWRELVMSSPGILYIIIFIIAAFLFLLE